MVFEGFQQATAVPRRKRSWVFVVSVVLHGAALVFGVAYSFWHVDELKMPGLTVTFVSGLPPTAPPPPAAALGGGESAVKKKVAAKPKPTTPKPEELVAPRETKPEPKVEAKVEQAPEPSEKPAAPSEGATNAPPGPGRPDGVVGGKVDGVVGGDLKGVSGGTGTGSGGGVVGGRPMRSKFLPPQLGGAQKLSGEDPEFPAMLRQPGARYVVIARICVGIEGNVETISISQAAHPLLDSNVARAVKASWRFRPLLSNGSAVPFCYNGNFEFRAD